MNDLQAAHLDRFVETACDSVQLVKLQAGDWTRMPQQCSVRLASSHCANADRQQMVCAVRSHEFADLLSHIRTAPSPLPLMRA